MKLLEAHSRTVKTTGIYTPWTAYWLQKKSSTVSKSKVRGQKRHLLGLRPRKAPGAARPTRYIVLLRPPGGAPHSKANNSKWIYMKSTHYKGNPSWKGVSWAFTQKTQIMTENGHENSNDEGKRSWKRSWNQIVIAKRSWQCVSWAFSWFRSWTLKMLQYCNFNGSGR